MSSPFLNRFFKPVWFFTLYYIKQKWINKKIRLFHLLFLVEQSFVPVVQGWAHAGFVTSQEGLQSSPLANLARTLHL
ncbi:MAG: hypothetical protein BAA01_16705 [Bacillus thermozeamaize]|uniref:Uncharacterized protein n=1 Tax=Bacillus thermozeamaize TaxID=230954 RepID=A0A1Y3PPJ0_9BACI|nr:MAG: hypothetical protein BAA01_16705 [Bacillus thermozeamaize]